MLMPAPPSARDVAFQSLEAQSALLRYALALFAVCLPVFVWAASFAENAAWMAATFAIFAINWAAFYGVVNWVKAEGQTSVRRRVAVHVAGGLLWAAAVAQIAALAHFAGPARETLLLMAAAGSVACIFFSAPLLPALLIVGPLAAAGPLTALFIEPASRDQGVVAAGGVAFALALGLILNRSLRSQFALAAERETLIKEHAGALAEAEKLARSKSDIVSTLSHEIRNGLNGVTHVLAAAAAAGQGARAAPSREQLTAALEATQELIGVLNTTLDAESADSGRLSLDLQPFDLTRLVRDLVVLHRPQATAKGVEMTLHVDPELEGRSAGGAIGDVIRTRQVLANLLGNAVKYTVRGRIEARLELREDGRIAVEIADTGPGLTVEELERAFEPFRRVQRTGVGIPGAGLGLSLSRRLAALMGGELTGQSAVGVGSCFTFAMPYDPAATIAPPEAAPRLSSTPKLKVLVAEDDGLNAAMLRAILEQLGHQVVHVQNGQRAIEMAGTLEFDLFMLDVRMPVMDGVETAAALRTMDGLGRTPIIAVTGGDATEAQACLDAGADTVLRKPVTVASVARSLTEATSPRRGRPRAVA